MGNYYNLEACVDGNELDAFVNRCGILSHLNHVCLDIWYKMVEMSIRRKKKKEKKKRKVVHIKTKQIKNVC